MELNKKKQAFIQFMVDYPHMGAAESARRAGYSARSSKQYAWELMKDPAVKAAIERGIAAKLEGKLEAISKKAAKGGEVTRESIASQYDDIIEECIMAGPVAALLRVRLDAVTAKASRWAMQM